MLAVNYFAFRCMSYVHCNVSYESATAVLVVLQLWEFRDLLLLFIDLLQDLLCRWIGRGNNPTPIGRSAHDFDISGEKSIISVVNVEDLCKLVDANPRLRHACEHLLYIDGVHCCYQLMWFSSL